MKRSCGVLLPIFSLPSPYGIGTFGKAAYEFIDYLEKAKVTYWQVLPMSPLTYGNSPYQSTSSFAGNMYLIDLDLLKNDGLIRKARYDKIDFGSDIHKVDYVKVMSGKKEILLEAAKAFIKKGNFDEGEFSYNKFKEEYKYFVESFAIFDLLKDRNSGKPFHTWDKLHKLHYDDVIVEFAKGNPNEIEEYMVIQYFFFKQWLSVKKYANDKGIKIIGDMPIYSSLDSEEVFSQYQNFDLDENRNPNAVAGCPPDAFSEDGQFWGNPLYNYDYMKKDGYKYFVKRMKHLATLYDMIRLDHFRGYANYYAIPKGETTAKNGRWMNGPGLELFEKLKEEVPNLSIIAEDLGIIDEPVYKLLADTGYPGMKVVEFAFGGDAKNSPYLPKNYNENAVAYLGTHDNDTFMGWFDKSDKNVKNDAVELLHLNKNTEHLDAITELFKSKANLTIILMQDLLGLGTEARINVPSTVSDSNWSYRFDKNYLDKGACEFLQKLVEETGRI